MSAHHPSRPQAAVPLFDTQRQYATIQDEVLAAISRVCGSGRYILGPESEGLERDVAAYCGAAHGVACASGSDALLLALMAAGVGPGDEVLVPSFTFFATASAVWRLGARPVFVDIEPATFNICPSRLADRIGRAAKAVIPVHLFGQCADMSPILEVARRHGLVVIEDAAQAIGAEDAGRRAGSIGDIGCLSFYPTKNLGCFGDGGMLTTNDPALADRLNLLRGHGMRPRYYHQVVGINSRLDALQAAVLAVKLRHLERWTLARRENAARYHELFAASGLDHVLGLPAEAPGRRHVWNQYVVRVPDGRRDALQAHLARERIGTEIYYPLGLDQQECFRWLSYAPGSLPETERAAREVLALPIFPELAAEEQAQVVRQMAAYFGATVPTTVHSLPRPKYLDRSAGATSDAVRREIAR
jgi:dTDP-4-amino-4,6-dideoxygalactose transaminase